MTAIPHCEFTILPPTKYTRSISFRSDEIGVYFLLWKDSEEICGVISYQYPSRCGDYFRPGFGASYWGNREN